VPGALDVDAFWRNLRDGVESVTRFTHDELEDAGVPREIYSSAEYAPFGAILEEHDEFDAPFFGFSPRDAALLDPQFRQFLECGWEALESAGYDPSAAPGSVGVFAGVGMNAYNLFNLYSNPELIHRVGEFHIRHVGNDKDFLSTRLSYHLNLRGPSVNVQTACSTSLVAVHLASQSVLGGECDMALAGAVSVQIPQRKGTLFTEGGIIAPDGHCRAFDADAQGTVFGSGVAVVVLKRLEDALADRDPIRAVIRGSAINNDGSLKAGYMAPSVDAQSEVIAEALAVADVDADSISYVSAHGTGTPVGDPIEITALSNAFRQTTERKQFCAVGSIKTNIGHLDTAAGTASLIATVNALEHREIPPCVHFKSPNPSIDFESSPFFVNAERLDWERGEEPRRAGVSSLGVGGTNAHVIVEEAPDREASSPSRGNQLLVVSARTEGALDRATQRLAEYLRRPDGAPLADVAHTLQVGRASFAHRRIVVCQSAPDAVDALEKLDPERVFSGRLEADSRSVVFQFPGGGAQYPNMAKDLYATEPAFASEVDRCLEILRSRESLDLFEVLFPPPEKLDTARAEILKPSLALPLLLTVEYALAKLWMSWGVKPSAMIGHSMGEYTAGCLAEVFPLETALSLVTLRGRLFETLPDGGMTSVPLPHDEVAALMPDGLSFAAINGPSLCVASGPVEKLEELERALADAGHESQRLKISVAAHSAMLEPVLEEFRTFLKGLEFNEPTLPFVSNVSGTWIRPDEATDPEYWVRHLRHTVRYSEGLDALLEDPERILIEIGPGRVMSSLASMHPLKTAGTAIVSSLRHPKENVCDQALLLDRLGRVWMAGGTIDWSGFYVDETRDRVPLPTYSFDHQRHWIEPGDHILRGGAALSGSTARNPDIADWFSRPTWRAAPRRLAAATDGDATHERLVVFAEDNSLAGRLVDELRARGHSVAVVAPGDRFEACGDGSYSVRIDDPDDYDALLERCASDGELPSRVVYAWSLGGASADASRLDELDARVARSFHGLLLLGQALGRRDLESTIAITVVSSRARQVLPEETVDAEKAVLFGPSRVLPAEIANLSCSSVDVVEPSTGSWKERRVVDQLLAEILEPQGDDRVVAYRGADRLVESFESVRVPPTDGVESRIRSGGAYLVTGGLGGIGSLLAEHLASRYDAKLILTSRDGMPDAGEWDDWARVHGDDDRMSRRIRQVRRLESLGGEVVVLRADVTSVEDMSSVVAVAKKRYGKIDGVFHAAGVIDDALLQMKTIADVDRVLAPKVRGSIVLDHVLRGADMDAPSFVVLFSSISSYAGLAGQVDYTAANSFLDSFAAELCARGDLYAVAVNWSAWSGVGMLAESENEVPSGETRDVAHPMLDRVFESDDGSRTYSSRWSASDCWFLDEHRNVEGDAFLPGTAYLELVRGLAVDCFGEEAVEIADAVFLSPLFFADGESREIEARASVSDRAADVEVFSRRADSGGASWQMHFRARVDACPSARAPTIDVREIQARCPRIDTGSNGGGVRLRQEEHLRFGPRWRVLRETLLGSGEGVAELALAEEFHGDLESFSLHPALLDMATAFGLPLLEGYDDGAGLFVPLSYDRVVAYSGIPAHAFCHLRTRNESGAGSDIAVFDLDVVDAEGHVVAAIEGFSMLRVEGIDGSASSTGVTGSSVDSSGGAAPTSALLQSMIAPDEGLEALERILASDIAPRVIVSTSDVAALIERLREEAGLASAPSESSGGAIGGSKRPDLSTAYVAAESDLEKSLLAIWEEALGVEEIGVHDNFFELGGHSLLLTQMLSKIRGLVGNGVTLRTLFEKPTVGSLAESFESDDPKETEAAAGSAIKRVSREGHRVSRSVLGSD
jgi:acyl transferase domain-containing protein